MIQNVLHYILVKNNLHADKDPYMARVVHQKSISMSEVLDEMERNTSMPRGDLQASILLFEEAVTDFASKGYRVDTPVGIYLPSMRGTFSTIDGTFHNGRGNHRIKLTVAPPRKMEKRVIENLKTEKVPDNGLNGPSIFEVMNLNPSENGTLTPGNLIRIKGERLKFDPDKEDEGIFFRYDTGPTVKASYCAEVRYSGVIFMVPDLDEGEYRLQIRCRTKGPRIRVAEHPIPLTVRNLSPTPVP